MRFFELLEYFEVDSELSRSESGRLIGFEQNPLRGFPRFSKGPSVTYLCPAHSL